MPRSTKYHTWVSFASVFSFIYCWVLIFALSPFKSWFICSRRWCIDKLGVFLANKKIYVSWSTSELRVRLAPWNRFKPSSKIFYWPYQRRYFFCGYFIKKICLCLVFAMPFLRFLRSRRQSRPENLCRRILVVSPSGSFARVVTPWFEFIWVPFPAFV